MAQSSRTAVSRSEILEECRLDVNANTTTAVHKTVETGEDRSLSRRNETKLNRFGFKGPPGVSKSGVAEKSAQVQSKTIERQHSMERCNDLCADSQPVVDRVGHAANLDVSEGATVKLFHAEREVSRLNSGRGMIGRGIFHSDESLARHHVTADVSNRKQGTINRVASHKQLTGQRSLKRIQLNDSKEIVSVKNCVETSSHQNKVEGGSSGNTIVTDSTSPSTCRPTQVSTVRESQLHNKFAPKIMPGRTVTTSQTNSALLKSASMLAKQTSENSPNQRLKMIVNYRSDRSSKALLKSTYCSGDQCGAPGGRTDSRIGDCTQGTVLNGLCPADVICTKKNNVDLPSSNSGAVNGIIKSGGEVMITGSTVSAAAAARTSRAHVGHCNGVGTVSQTVSVSTASTQTSATTTASDGAFVGEIVVMEKTIHRKLLTDLDHYRSLLLQLQRYLTQDVVEDDPSNQCDESQQWNALISLQQENTHLTEQVLALEKLVTDKNKTIISLQQQLSQLTVVSRASDDLHAILHITDSTQTDVASQDKIETYDLQSSSCNLVSSDDNIRAIKDKQNKTDECAVFIEDNNDAARLSRLRLQSDAECLDSIFDFHSVDPSVYVYDIHLNADEDGVVSCSEDGTQVTVYKDELNSNRHHSENVVISALGQLSAVSRLVNKSSSADECDEYHEMPFCGLGEPIYSSKEHDCFPTLSTCAVNENKTQVVKPVSRLPGPRTRSIVKVNSTPINGSCNQTDVA